MSAGGAMNNQNPRRRKRPEKGPGSKFLGEKRRREQETSYLEELAELITANLNNPESLNMLPDKRAFLLDSVNKIKRIRLQQQQDLEQGSEVQHSHVSSSKPGMLSGDSLSTNLLEAMDGFLFVVNSLGEIEFVTENVKMYLNFKQEDLIGSTIYSFIHVGDHNQFTSCLHPTATSGIWSQDSSSQNSRNRSFTCRMLTKSVDEEDNTQEQHYENLRCSAILKPKEDGQSSNSAESDTPAHLVCIASRAMVDDCSNMMLVNGEEFTTSLDLTATITTVDLTHLKPPHYSKEELVGQIIYKFCHGSDRAELKKHFDEALEKGTSSSSMYRFQIYTDTWVRVQTTSRVYRNHHSGKPECLVAVHTVIRDEAQFGPSQIKPASMSANNMSAIASTSTNEKTNRILEALSSISNSSGNKSLSGNLGGLNLNTLKTLMMKRQQQQHMQQHMQQQQQQGMGLNSNKASTSGMGKPNPTNPNNAQDVLDSLKRSSLSNMLQVTDVRNRNGAMETSSVYPVAYSNAGDRHPIPEKIQRLDRSPSDSNIASSTERNDRMHGDKGDDGDVFLPEHSNHKKGRYQEKGRPTGGGEGSGSGQADGTSPNLSPDTNEEEKDSTLSKNTLLQKLLQDDVEEDKTEEDGESSKGNSPMCAEHKNTLEEEVKMDEKAFSKLLKSEGTGDKSAKADKSEDEMDSSAESPKEGDGTSRVRRKSIERENTILSKLLDGDTQSMFGSGKLPNEQPGFVCSNVVSTTTALQKSEQEMEKNPSCKSDKNMEGVGAAGGSNGPKKRKNVLLQKLLMEDVPPLEKVPNETTCQESTTSPTVTTTKPGMSGGQPSNIEDNSVDSFGNDDDSVVQHLLHGSLPDEVDTSQPNMIMDFLKELENVPDPTQDSALMHHLLNPSESSGPAQNRYPPNSSSVGVPSQNNQYKVPMGPESLPGPGPHQRPDSSGNMNNPSLLGQGVGHDSTSTMHHGMPSGMNSQHRPPVSRTNSRDSFTGGSGGMHQNSNNFGRFGSQQQESFSMDNMQNVMPPNQTAPMQKSMSQLHLSGGGQQQNPFELDPMQDVSLPGNTSEEQGLSEEDVTLLQQLEQVLNSGTFPLPELENNFATDRPPVSSMDLQHDSNMLQSMLNSQPQTTQAQHANNYPTSSGGGMGMQQQQQQQQQAPQPQQQRGRQQAQPQPKPPQQQQQHPMMGMGGPTGGSRMGQGPMPDMSAMMGPGMAAPAGQPRFPQQGHPSQQQQPQQTASQPMQFNQMNSMQQQLQHQLQQQQHGPTPPHSMPQQQMSPVPKQPQPPMSSAPGSFVRPHSTKQLRHTILMRSRMKEQQQQQQQQQQLQQQQQQQQQQLQQQAQQQQQQQQQQQHRQWQIQQQRQQQLMRQQQINAAAVAANQQQMSGNQQQQQMGSGPILPQQVANNPMNPMQQNQRLMQQQKNLIMLQQQQQQQTFTGPQVEGGVFPPMDTQAFQEKLSDVLNPTAGALAPNVSIQKSPGPYGPQMSSMGNRPMGPGNQMMGGDSRQQMAMNQPFPGQAGANRGGAGTAGGDFMFNSQMMPQGRGTQLSGPGYQGGMGHSSSAPNVFNFQEFNNPGGMSGGVPGGMTGGNMPGGKPQHMMPNAGMMGPSQHQPGMGVNPSMPGQHNIGINPNIQRPNLATGGNPRQQAPTLTRSMSLPTTNMISGNNPGGNPPNRVNQYHMPQHQQQQQQQPGFPAAGFRGNQTGAMQPHFPGNSMGMQPGQMSNTTAPMFSSPATTSQMRWSGPNGGMTRGQQPHQGQMFPGPGGGPGGGPQSSEMLRGMANSGGGGGGTQELQNMMNRRLKRGDSLPANPNMMQVRKATKPTNPPKYSLQGAVNPSIAVPPNLTGQNSMNLGQQPSGEVPNPSNSYLGTSASNNSGKNRCPVPGTSPSNLDMLSMSMEMFEPEFPKSDGQNPIASSTTNPTSQPDSTSAGPSRPGPGVDPLKPYAEMQSNEEAKLRYQEFYKISGAQTAPDACTRVTNLFRNQLTGQPLPGQGNGRGVGGPQGMGNAPGMGGPGMQGGGVGNGGMVPQQQQHNQQQFGNEEQQEGMDGDGKSNNSLLQKLLLE